MTGQRAQIYGSAPGHKDAFLYSPLFEQLIHPLTLLPWPIFCTTFVVLNGVAILWLVKPLPLRWAGPACLLAVPAMLSGDVNCLIGCAIVIGMSRPAAWGLPLLTKIAPAGPGLLWLVTRREWKQLIRAAAVIGPLVALSVAVEPGAWHDWMSLLLTHGQSAGWGRAAREVAALVVAFWAARRNVVWLIPIACWLANPMDFLHPNALVILAAVPRLVEYRRRTEPQHRDKPRPEVGSMASYTT
jgi:hypothetical protein